jgi:hypothetical protein
VSDWRAASALATTARLSGTLPLVADTVSLEKAASEAYA